MTNQQDTALLPVTDADRKCAQTILQLAGKWSLAELVAAGARDDNRTVQLIAAHRLQAKPSASCEAGEVERVARAIDPIEWKTIDHWWPYRGTANYDDRIDDMRARSMDRARAAIAALRANAPEAEA